MGSAWNCVFLTDKGFSGYIFGSPSWIPLERISGLTSAVTAQFKESPTLGTKGCVDST